MDTNNKEKIREEDKIDYTPSCFNVTFKYTDDGGIISNIPAKLAYFNPSIVRHRDQILPGLVDTNVRDKLKKINDPYF